MPHLVTAAVLAAEGTEREGINPILNGVLSFVILTALLVAVLLWGRGRG